MNDLHISALEERQKIDEKSRKFQELLLQMNIFEIEELQEHIVAIQNYFLDERKTIH